MGSLRQRLHKHFSPNDFFLGLGLTLLLGLGGCVPATQGNHLEFFFSEKVWGGSPFDELQKKQLFVAALEGRKTESVSKPVPFEISDASVIVKRFDALYEVTAATGLPKVRSGYLLWVDLPTPAPERVTLTNTLTGVSWSLELKSVTLNSK